VATNRAGRMKARRRSDIAAAILAILVIVGIGYALRSQHTRPVAVEPSAAHVDRPGPADAARKTLLFIGDSYVTGTGLDETSYGCMAAARMGWYCKVAAGPGTGYVSGGPVNRFELDYLGQSTSFGERLAGLALKYHPDIVVLDGGRNDVFVPPDTVYAAMVSTITAVRQTWPAATVIVLRPRFLSTPADTLGYDDGFFDRLRAEDIAQHMVIFADPIGRLVGKDTSGFAGSDNIHPTRLGELAMSTAFYDSLIQLGFVPVA
jgi:hypothetical protein